MAIGSGCYHMGFSFGKLFRPSGPFGTQPEPK